MGQEEYPQFWPDALATIAITPNISISLASDIWCQSVVSIVGGAIVDVGLGGTGCDGVVLVGSGGLVDGVVLFDTVVFVDGVVLVDSGGGVQW